MRNNNFKKWPPLMSSLSALQKKYKIVKMTAPQSRLRKSIKVAEKIHLKKKEANEAKPQEKETLQGVKNSYHRDIGKGGNKAERNARRRGKVSFSLPKYGYVLLGTLELGAKAEEGGHATRASTEYKTLGIRYSCCD